MINAFPGYEFVNGKNMYRGVDVGRGGYVYDEPGIYTNVALLDIQGMHPHSIISLNAFGEYTQNFKDMLDARIAIKHGDFDKAKTMLNGRLAPYLDDKPKAKDLSNALKTALNSCYGLTSANFDNPMRDIRNKNNLIALKGSLFMKTLQDEIQARGFRVVHIKTDSMKVPNATSELIKFMCDFAAKYGYSFDHEATYERLCLVNGSTYIAKHASTEWCEKTYGYVPEKNAKAEKDGELWTATAKQFQVPYVFKTLFSKEPLIFEDFCETCEVKGAMYLDRNENLPEGEHDYQFIGKVGNFCPIKPGFGGAELLREAKDKDGNIKYDAVTGTKGYRWLEAEFVKALGKEDIIDKSYYRKLVDEAIYGSGTGKNRKPGISDFGDFERFVADEPYIVETTETYSDFPPDDDDLPWYTEDELGDLFNKR